MQYLSVLFSFISLLTFTLFPSCHTQPKNTFNAYMPPSFEEYFVDYEPSLPKENSHYWNVDDVDISYIQPSRNLIAFTFDDSPSSTLSGILQVFSEYNQAFPDCPATATFFFNGKLINHFNVDHLYTAHLLGFELGNHTQNHLHLPTLSSQKLAEEIAQTDAILQTIDGKPRHLLRAPFGHVNETVKRQVKTPIIDWSIDTRDWTGCTKEQIYKTVWEEKFPGAIVLMHDGYPPTMSALKQLLHDLYNANYQVVSVSAMAKMHSCALKNGSVYIRARKQ